MDLVIFGQAVKHLAAGQAPVVDLKASGFLAFGDHFDPVIALAAPLYALWPDIRVLLCLQALLIAAAVGVITDAAMRALGGRRGLAIGAAFAASIGVQHALAFDFHEVAFAAPLLALALRAYLHDRWRTCAVLAAGLLLVKEDCAFLVLGIAMALALRGRRRLAAALGASAVLGLATILTIVIPALSYWHRYTYAPAVGDPLALVAAAARNLSASLVTDGTAIRTLAMLLAGVGIIAVRSPLIWVTLLPFAVRAANANPAYWGLDFHYNLLMEVSLFVALVDALRRLPRLRSLAWAMITVMTVMVLAHGPLAIGARDPDQCPRCPAARTILDLVPDGTTVAADTYLLPHLVDRTTAYLLTPDFIDSADNPLTPDWVVFDERTSTYGGSAWTAVLRRALASVYEDIASNDGYLLLHRRPTAAGGAAASAGTRERIGKQHGL